MTFADTHTHLYLEDFDPDLSEVMQRAESKGINYLFLPNIDSTSFDRMMQVAARYSDRCHPMAGLHPSSVGKNYREELQSVSDHLSAPDEKFVAIGEIGIDLYWDKTFEQEQKIAFGLQIDLALEHHLPVVIHTRNSMDMALELIGAKNAQDLCGVFHCFSGNVRQATLAIELGFMLGIGGVVTYRNSGLQKVVEAVPLEHLVLETDAPFLPPVPHRGQRNEPSYIPLIAARVAEIKKTTLEKVAEITTKNTLALFRVQ